MVRIGAVILNVSDRHRASAFWSQALGYTPEPDNSDFLFDPDGKGVRLHLDETDRSHLDLWAEPGQSQAEVDRMLALGATKPDWVYPEGADFVVLADPDGNLFCIIGD
jgi:catechol 2,3-dioxygenase-like lactoylglutathione lyase family enzyme